MTSQGGGGTCGGIAGNLFIAYARNQCHIAQHYASSPVSPTARLREVLRVAGAVLATGGLRIGGVGAGEPGGGGGFPAATVSGMDTTGGGWRAG